MSHEVRMDISNAFVPKTDVTFDIRENGSKLGTLLISRGNIEWVPAGNSVNKRRMTWAKFAKFMRTKGAKKKIK
jgi:hypothetical protein